MRLNLEDETHVTTFAPDSAGVPTAAPMLTILVHPDPDRVGECLSLRALGAGKEVLVSRGEPTFSRPEGNFDSAEGSPLGGRFLSRQPIRFRPDRRSGGVLVDLRTTRTLVEVDGKDLEEGHYFSPQEIVDGAVLRLARKIVLLLHRGPVPSTEPLPPSYGLVGAGLAMWRLRKEIRKLAPLEVPVLLRGETGTGKELVARALHDHSPRADGPFVAVNMAVLGPSLAAAALFGVERGAYTGADRKRQGHFKAAQGGTLFLDEIGEAPPEVQVMLLRALETQEIQPVGSTDFMKVDVRIVAATDARLEEAMESGAFKMPLYHRLAGYTVYLPGLRERREDLGRLLYFFLNEELAALGQPPLRSYDRPWPPAELIVRLAKHPWPGNVRELRNVARRLAISGRDEPVPDLELLLLPQSAHGTPAGETPGNASDSTVTPVSSKRRVLRKMEDVTEGELLDALRESRWQIQATADALRVSRPNLYRLMEASSSVRTAHELGREEIQAAVVKAGGDLDAAAYELEVSVLGLKRRMKALGLDTDSSTG